VFDNSLRGGCTLKKNKKKGRGSGWVTTLLRWWPHLRKKRKKQSRLSGLQAEKGERMGRHPTQCPNPVIVKGDPLETSTLTLVFLEEDPATSFRIAARGKKKLS